MFASIVTDLGFGDAGKGTTVDFLARQTNNALVVRFNGGAQAAHNVHTNDGKHHTFSQFGSAMLVPGTSTFLSRFVLFDPFALYNEAQGLQKIGVSNPLGRMMVDGDAYMVSPFQKAANRIREALRGGGRHGSVGMGIGETMSDSIAFPEVSLTVADVRDVEMLIKKLTRQQELKHAEFKLLLEASSDTQALQLERKLLTDSSAPKKVAVAMIDIARQIHIVSTVSLKRLSKTKPLIFEGAQGVLLDEWHGFHPFTTWSTTTDKNARALLSDIGYTGPVHSYGVVRAYSTRHGPGPFPSEDAHLTQLLPDTHNQHGRWQGGFRVGWLDLPLTRYALNVSEHIDSLVVTHLDRVRPLSHKRIVTAYEVSSGALTASEEELLIFAPKKQVQEKERVYTLKPKSSLIDLTYQERLTKVMQKVQPVYETVVQDDEAFAAYIGEQLHCPIAVTSYGKTAQDKYMCLPVSQTV